MQLSRAAFFVVGRDDEPRALLDVGVPGRAALSLAMEYSGHSSRAPGEVHVRELPALQRLGIAGLEAGPLLFEGDGEPVFDDDDPGPYEHPLELEGQLVQELGMLFLAAEAHDPLDVGAVVHDRSKRTISPAAGRCSTCLLEITTGCAGARSASAARPPGRCAGGAFGDPPGDATLARRSAALEDHQDLQAWDWISTAAEPVAPAAAPSPPHRPTS